MKALFRLNVAMHIFAAALPLMAESPQPKKDTVLSMLKEDVLSEQPKGASTRIYRLMIEPTWGNRFCFKVQTSESGATLVMKRLDGQSGYGDGPLAETKQFKLSKEDLAAFEAIVSASGYEKMDRRDPNAGLDGDSWTLEVSSSGFYHIARRWCPNAYDPKKRGTLKFVESFRWVADKCGVTKSITNKGGAIFDR
jgi:hypothetical protein